MKKIPFILLSILFLLFTACSMYNTPTSSVEEFGERWKLGKIVSNAVGELIKVKTMGGGMMCNIYPSSRNIKTTLDDNIKSIVIIDEFNFRIGKNPDDIYRLKVTVSLKRKH